MRMICRPCRNRGAVMVAVVVCLIVVTVICCALLRLGLSQRGQLEADERRMQADWLAESGLELAAARLAAARDYAGETWEPSPDDLQGPWGGRVAIVVRHDGQRPSLRLVTVQADYPRDATMRARQSKFAVVKLASELSGEQQ